MKFAKALKGLGKKASGLGKKLKGVVSHAPRAGYNRAGQPGLLGGTTKSAASRALAPVKAKAKAMGAKIRNTAHNAAVRAKDASRLVRGRGSMAGSTKSGLAGKKGDYVGGQEKFADFDSIGPKSHTNNPFNSLVGQKNPHATKSNNPFNSMVGKKNPYATKSKPPLKDNSFGNLEFDKVFPKSGKPTKAGMMKSKAQAALNSGKAKLQKYAAGRSGKAGMPSNGTLRYDSL